MRKPELVVHLDGSVESRALEVALTRAKVRFCKLHSGGNLADRDSFPREVPALETQYGHVEGFANIARYFNIPNLQKILDELKQKICPSCGRDR
jgi:hypothetical protein